jgi:serine/threonine protein kinase
MAAQSWGPWKNLGLINEGGRGRVFKVEHTETRTIGAIKLLKNSKANERFKREIEAAAKLEHPHIVRLLDYSLDNDPRYAVYDFEPGGSLGQIPTTDLLRIPLPQRLHLCEQVCAALHAAHQESLVHRDVKPDNILVSTDRRTARLCDFGLVYCEEEERLTETMEQVGSRYFIPPELEAGRLDQVSARSDVYCMGKVLHYIVSGQMFSREQHRDVNYDLATVFDDQYLEAISMILDFTITADPASRLANAEDMRVLIERVESLQHHELCGKSRTSSPGRMITPLLVVAVVGSSWLRQRARGEVGGERLVPNSA